MSTEHESTTEHYIVSAYQEHDKVIVTKLSHPIVLPYSPENIVVTDTTIGLVIAVTHVDPVRTSAITQSQLVQITLAQALDITHLQYLLLKGYSPHPIVPRNVLSTEDYTYTGNDLGCTFTLQNSTFRLWAPTASAVELLLYDSETGPLTEQLAMQKSEKGTWCIEVLENLENWYYLYLVTIHGTDTLAVDPYARALAVNAERGMIIDLPKTNPVGWQNDHLYNLANLVDAVIYELHIRDFSIAASSGITHKGQYLAFTEHNTTGPENISTGITSLQDLGVTHVHLLPMQEFASIDENIPNQYNWGYDPRNYNVPEGAYASTPHGTARIIECKRMIQSLHQANLGVVMDVVYNHTFAVGNSDFDKIVPQYFYRTDDNGNYSNGSGVGNELATERPMVQKFVRDSLLYLANEYHIDGFRFDLMALLGIETMRLASQDLHAINPNILLYGEPWAAGRSTLPDDQLLFKGKQQGLNLAIFNDNIRNNLIGTVFDSHAQGFATGVSWLTNEIKQGVSGSIHDFAATPVETINYVTSHDNMTLWDKITASTPLASNEQRIKMAMFSQAIILTAQGVAFIHGGEEFLRTKGGNDNSYNAGDAINQFNWERKALYINVFNYYAGLIHLRMQHPAFRMTTASAINQHLTFLDSPASTITFIINDHANGDDWRNILVIYNPHWDDKVCPLPDGSWTIAAEQDQVNEQGLRLVHESVTVGAISCTILFQL